MTELPPFDLQTTPLTPGTTLIEASAGTGKTFTIAALFVRFLVEHDLAVGEILVTTYTKAATAELRDRIRRAVQKALTDAADSDAKEKLTRALANFDEAAIYTIHGFCQRMLQDRAFESGLPFSAELAEDQNAVIREVAEDFWRLQTYERDPVLTALALLGKLTPAAFEKLLGEVTSKPLLAIEPAPGRLAVLQQEIAALFAEMRALWAQDSAAVQRHFTTHHDWASGSMKQGKPATMAAALAALASCCGESGAPLEAFGQLDLLAQSKIEKATKKNGVTPRHRLFELCERCAPLREEYALALRVEFLAWARGELARRKLQRNELSFDDLLTRLHGALAAPGGEQLAALIRGRFRAALIDEFQDTDAIQEASFRRIFEPGDGWLYLIGDPKQAIYAFRGADVFTYLAAAQRARAGFTLGTNYRSETPLVEAVNAVFSRAPNVFALEQIHFRPVAAAGQEDAAPLTVNGERQPPLRLWWWEEDEPIKAATAHERLPRVTAAQIARMLAGGVKIGDRAVEPRDFAVLVATHKQAAAVQSALASFRIPAVLHSAENVFASSEAADLQAILTAVAEPTRDDRLRAALATPTLGGGATHLDLLARDERGWEETLLRFARWHETWNEHGFIQMFRELLQAAHVRPRLLAWPDGERRLTNLLHIAELLHQAATAQRLGAASLVKWLGEQRAPGAPAGEERELRLESDAHAVQVVTMHKSKGLEYHIVFCPFCWGHAGLRDSAGVVFHDPANEERLTLDLGTDALAAHTALAERERLAEQVRLLYVALTRAKHQCHFVWGRFHAHEASAAAWVLHPPPAGAAESTTADLTAEDAENAEVRRGGVAGFLEHAKQLTAAGMRADLEALARSAPQAIAIENLPDENAAPYRAPDSAGEVLKPRLFTGRIARDWRIASFTSLTSAAEGEQPDFDQFTATATPEVVTTGIHAFPRGAKTGVCFHEIFEQLDFRDGASIDGLVARKLEAFGFDAAAFQEAVADCVRKVLARPLEAWEGERPRESHLPASARRDARPPDVGRAFALVTISNTFRLNELEFYFPFSRITTEALAERFGNLPIRVDRLHFEPQRGFIKGFIDLVFEHAGRFYILDWKSNWLGADAEAYHAEAVRAEMVRHHYVLQYHLYALALHRHLARRLPGYEYERDFGGVFYVFVRGVDPARPELGVHRDRPTAEFMAQLDALFAGEEGR